MIINGMLNDGRLQSPIVADYKTNKHALTPASAPWNNNAARKTGAKRARLVNLFINLAALAIKITMEITKEISGAHASGNVWAPSSSHFVSGSVQGVLPLISEISCGPASVIALM